MTTTTSKTAAKGPARAGKARAEPMPSQSIVPITRSTTKTDTVIALLRRPEGASIDEIMTATGWQRHSVRGALAGAVKKKLGDTVLSELTAGVRRYRAPAVSS